MSNTSTVTPYESTSYEVTQTSNESSSPIDSTVNLAAACVAGAVVGAIKVVSWLAEETEAEKKSLKLYEQKRRAEQLSAPKSARLTMSRNEPLRVNTMGLHLNNAESLVSSAKSLGYRVEQFHQPAAPLAKQTGILLRNSSGERLAIVRNTEGRLVLSTGGNRQRIQELVRQHTIDRAVEHFRKQGMTVQTTRLANGELQMLASERKPGKPDGAAKIKAQISKDGRSTVDVDCVAGNRCERIVQDFAKAVGGVVTETKRKSAFYNLPGEPRNPVRI